MRSANVGGQRTATSAGVPVPCGTGTGACGRCFSCRMDFEIVRIPQLDRLAWPSGINHGGRATAAGGVQ
jgi:hypothetical protein